MCISSVWDASVWVAASACNLSLAFSAEQNQCPERNKAKEAKSQCRQREEKRPSHLKEGMRQSLQDSLADAVKRRGMAHKVASLLAEKVLTDGVCRPKRAETVGLFSAQKIKKLSLNKNKIIHQLFTGTCS